MKHFITTSIVSALMLIMFSNLGWGQIIYSHDFGTTSITTKPYTGTPTTLNSNLSNSSWTTSATAFGGLNGSSGASLSLSNSSGTPTITLTFDVASGYSLSVTSFNFWRVRSNTGAQNWALTINGISVGNGTIPTTGATIGQTNVSNTISGLTGTVTVIYTMSGASGSGTSRLDDFTLNGTVTAVASNIINTGSVSAPFCINNSTTATGTVAYTSTGSYSGSTFTAYLSDATGSFATITNIGTASVTGTNPSGNINITIPAGTPSGTGYKIRIDCNSPAVTGSISSPFEIVNGANNVSGANAVGGNQQATLTWTNPTGCYDEIMIVASTSTISATPSGNGSAYTASLTYGNGTGFGGGFVVYKGITSAQNVISLSNGTTYYFKYFTRKGTDWSTGVEVTTTPNNNKYAHGNINWSTGNWYDASTGGNIVSAPASGDNVFTNGYVVTVDVDAGCANLTVTNLTNAITISSGITLTISGYLDCTGTPSVDVVGGTGTVKFTGTGAVIGTNWGASAVFSNITFDPGNGNTATFSKKIKFTDNIIINSGTVSNTVTSEIYTTTNGAGTVTINANSTLDLSSAACMIYGSTTSTNPMSSVTVNGTLITVSQVNANTFIIGPNGLFKTSRTGTFYTTTSAPGTMTFDGTYESNGTTQNIPSTVYNNLILSNNGAKSLSGNITVNGKLTLGGSASFSLNSNTLTYGTSSTLEYAGTAAQTTSDNEFSPTGGPKNCNVNNANGVILNSDKTINGTLTVYPNSIFDAGNFVISGTGDWDVQNGSTIKSANINGLNGNNTTTGGLSSYSTTANYEFNGTSTQITGTYLPLLVNNLTLNNSTEVSLSDNITVSGILNLNAGTFALNGKLLTINGTQSGTGTLTGSALSSLVIGGTGDMGTIYFTPGSEVLGNLTMNRTSSGSVTIGSNLNVNTGLTLTSGIINMGANTLTLGTSILSLGSLTIADIGSNASYITGNFERWMPAGVSGDVYFPVGTTNAYRPAIINYTNNKSSGGKLMVSGNDTDPGTVNPGATLLDDTYTVDRYSKQAWWKFTTSTITGGMYDISLGAFAIDGVSQPNFGLLRLMKRADNTSNWSFSGTHSNATGTYSLPFVKRTGISNGFSEFGISGYSIDGNTLSNAPLPVHLSSFTSSANRRNITLNWTTASENNNSGFDVERKSADGKNWVKAGFVTGSGTTASASNYSFTDRNLNSGKYKYRLKQIDYNGNYEYFELNGTPEVGVPDKYNISQNYPNPFNPTTKIDLDIPFDSKVSLVLYDMAGREVRSLIGNEMKAGYYTHLLDASSLSSGVYFYRVVMNSGKASFVQSKKMVLIK